MMSEQRSDALAGKDLDELQETQIADPEHRAWQNRHEAGLVVDPYLTSVLARRGQLHDKKGPGCR